MAIVDDYGEIASELRRIRAERLAAEAAGAPEPDRLSPVSTQHRMRSTPAGEMLYRRLVSQRRL